MPILDGSSSPDPEQSSTFCRYVTCVSDTPDRCMRAYPPPASSPLTPDKRRFASVAVTRRKKSRKPWTSGGMVIKGISARWLAFALFLALIESAHPALDDKKAAVSLDVSVGKANQCYSPTAGGKTASGNLSIAGSRWVASPKASTGPGQPFIISVDAEGKASEVQIEDPRLKSLEIRAIASLDSAFVVTGTAGSGQILAIVDGNGRVLATKLLPSDLQIMGIEGGTAKDFLIYGRLGSRPYFAALDRSLASLFERFPAAAGLYGQVVKLRYSAGRGSLLALVQGASKTNLEDSAIALARFDLVGNELGRTVVKAVYADFDDSSLGVAFISYGAGGGDIEVRQFDPALKQKWKAEPLATRMGIATPAVAIVGGRTVVVAANGLRLYMAGFDPSGRPLWNYWESSPTVSATNYFIAGDDKQLLIGHSDTKAWEAPGGTARCNRIRVLRF